MSSGCSRGRRGGGGSAALVALLAGVLAGCAGGPPPAPASPRSPHPDLRSPHVGVTVPRAAAGFELVKTQHYADPDLGSSWRYRTDSHPELWVDAYVYVAGIWPDDEAATADLSAQMKRDVDAAVAAGTYSDVEMLGRMRPELSVRGSRLTGIHLRMAMHMDKVALISHAHLFYLPPYTVKFRSSFPAFGNSSFDARIGQLVPAFLAALQVDAAVRCRPVTLHGIAGGQPGWVSKDGRDIFAASGDGEMAWAKLAARSARLVAGSGCAPVPTASAAPSSSSLAPP